MALSIYLNDEQETWLENHLCKQNMFDNDDKRIGEELIDKIRRTK